jgi:hypothetical protein
LFHVADCLKAVGKSFRAVRDEHLDDSIGLRVRKGKVSRKGAKSAKNNLIRLFLVLYALRVFYERASDVK